MRAVFLPATSIMNSVRFTSKFGLLGCVVLVVIAGLIATLFSSLNRDIDQAKNELSGIQILKPLNRVAQLMQVHRGMSAAVINGNESMKEKRATKENELTEAIKQADAALTSASRQSEFWRTINANWDEIRRDGMGWAAPKNIAQHTRTIDILLNLMMDVADESELTLDPSIDTYYLMDTVLLKMPAVLERLGQSRARGTAVLTKRELSPEMRLDMSTTMAEIANTLRYQDQNLGKVMRYSPSLQPTLSTASKEFSQSVGKVLTIIREDILTERFVTPPPLYFETTTTLIDKGYRIMYDTLFPQLEEQINLRIEAKRVVLMRTLGLSLLALLLVGYLAAGTYFSVIDSVEVFSRGARQLAQGKLLARFDTKGADELHGAGEDFNNMASAFRDLLGRVQHDMLHLRGVAEQLASSSQQISAGAGAQSDSATSMAALVEEMTVGVDHIAKNASDAQSCAHQSDEVAMRGGQIVHGVVNEIEQIAQTVNASAEAVENLGRQSDAISAIVSTIKDIADQTNLLALNAAIEAARAGESGRGFAVVADEVRKLAERTTKSTQEIADMIGAIQSGTEMAVSSMKAGVARVGTGVQQAKLAGEAIAQVQDHSRQVVEAVVEISNALREQASASTEIAQNVERIAQMAEQNNAAAVGNASTATELRRLAETLSGNVARFET